MKTQRTDRVWNKVQRHFESVGSFYDAQHAELANLCEDIESDLINAQSMIHKLRGELNRALDKVVELHAENQVLRENAIPQAERKSLPMMPEPLP